ncbi:MAG: hypothetical protein LKKZDAJK_001947 [Candidatus Fervidibacter sp.]
MREFRGVVKNSVVVLEDGNELPEGTKVRVIVEETAEWQPDWEVARQFIGGLRDRGGKTDVSERVDEYLVEGFFAREHLPPEEGGAAP